jgi:hypothetical protein
MAADTQNRQPIMLIISAELSPEQRDDVLLRPRMAGLDETLPALTKPEWERGCEELRIALFQELRQYTRRQAIALRAQARNAFFPQDKACDDAQRAAILDTIMRAMPYGDDGMRSRVAFQRRGMAVLAELRDRLTRQFAVATGQIARPTPRRMIVAAVAATPTKTTISTTTTGARMAAAVEGMLMLSSATDGEEDDIEPVVEEEVVVVQKKKSKGAPPRKRRRRRPWSKT